MHDEVVPAETAAIAPRLADVAASHELALGGGTACALRLGHRTSQDLDLFSLKSLDPPSLLADLSTVENRRLRGISEQELIVALGGVEVSATSLGREPLGEADEWCGVPVLSALDLAELKVAAAVNRGMARDLCDLHLLCLAGVHLEEAIRVSPIDAVVALKALTDVGRFEGQPALLLTRAWSVDAAIDYFLSEARRILA